MPEKIGGFAGLTVVLTIPQTRRFLQLAAGASNFACGRELRLAVLEVTVHVQRITKSQTRTRASEFRIPNTG